MPGGWRRGLAVSILIVTLVSGVILGGRSDPPSGDGQVTLARLRWGPIFAASAAAASAPRGITTTRAPSSTSR